MSTIEYCEIPNAKGSLHQENHRLPPAQNMLKLNVDASLNENLNQFSVGGVLQDHQGRLLSAFGKKINQPFSVVHGELLAIMEGIKLVYEKNFRNIQVASDTLLTVQAVTADQEDLGYPGACATKIKERLQDFIAFDIVHVRRSVNSVAHNIAVFSSSTHSSFVWMNDEFLLWLVGLVMLDYN
ncbi:uncharacterized protein [Henckelia pumila]|uniref:uncharacterized protein n=1 Tax=Henckelia pumila TaxID=405737 RepID=UPI003C6E108E